MVSCIHCGRKMHRICVLYFEPLFPEGLVVFSNSVLWIDVLLYVISVSIVTLVQRSWAFPSGRTSFLLNVSRHILKTELAKISVVGLPITRLGTFLEDRVNKYLHSNGINTGEVAIRMVSNADKILETRPGMKHRLVINCFTYAVYICDCMLENRPFCHISYFEKYNF